MKLTRFSRQDFSKGKLSGFNKRKRFGKTVSEKELKPKKKENGKDQ